MNEHSPCNYTSHWFEKIDTNVDGGVHMYVLVCRHCGDVRLQTVNMYIPTERRVIPDASRSRDHADSVMTESTNP